MSTLRPPSWEKRDGVPQTTQDEQELQSWMEAPSAFWLDPTRFERTSWPALPTEADITYDGTPEDLAVAYVTLGREYKVQLASNVPLRIASSNFGYSVWARNQATNEKR